LNESFKNIYVILHNVHSASKTIETAQVVYALGFSNYVVSKAEGSAAQSGVPDANRLAIKMKQNFMVLPDLKDVLDLFNFDYILLITSPKLVKEHIDMDQLAQRTLTGEKIAIIVSGSNSSFSRKEMDLGDSKSLEAKVDLGPSGSIAIILYSLLKQKE
jgi:SpoU rRNA methylase family enzyme